MEDLNQLLQPSNVDAKKHKNIDNVYLSIWCHHKTEYIHFKSDQVVMNLPVNIKSDSVINQTNELQKYDTTIASLAVTTLFSLY